MEDRLKPTLQNDKVILRPLELSDEDALWPIAKEKDLWIYGLKDLSLPGELRKYITKPLKIERRAIALCGWSLTRIAAKLQDVRA